MTDASVSTLKGPLNVEQGTSIASLPEHLQQFDIAPGGCWIARRRSPNGYAWNTSIKGRKGSAYKLVWEWFNGPTPEGRELHHTCHNGPGGCMAPHHLEPVTHKENILLSPVQRCAVNSRKTHCIHGHELTPENTYSQSEKAGRGRMCKTCSIENQKRWVAEQGRDEINRKRRDYYARNREQERARAAAKRERRRQREAS